jgi:uncharacterized Zn-binding protein involved in type VI secretion
LALGSYEEKLMSHHGSDPFDEKRAEFMRKLKDTTSFRGAIGAYPNGMLTKSDEGSIQFAIGEVDGKVVIDFGTPVAWLGMTPQEAADLTSSILRAARGAGRRQGKPVSFTIG